MQMIQTFESTILSDCSAHAAHLIVIPERSFLMQDRIVNADGIIQNLKLQKLAPITASQLAYSLSVLLSSAVPAHEMVQRLNETLYESSIANVTENQPISETDPLAITFAEKVAFERMIPFEQSPVDMESLANLVTKASAPGLGAYAGFVIAGSSPLLLITVPAGMIIFGAAKGVADALEEGLRERLLAYLHGENVVDNS